jgi:hypothetical protein
LGSPTVNRGLNSQGEADQSIEHDSAAISPSSDTTKPPSGGFVESGEGEMAAESCSMDWSASPWLFRPLFTVGLPNRCSLEAGSESLPRRYTRFDSAVPVANLSSRLARRSYWVGHQFFKTVRHLQIDVWPFAFCLHEFCGIQLILRRCRTANSDTFPAFPHTLFATTARPSP